MSDEDAISAQMIAEIESAVPDFIVLPGQEDIAFEFAHAIIETLALDDMHNLICVEHRTGKPSDRIKDSELLLTMVRHWLRFKRIPYVVVWYPSSITNKFYQVRITAAEQ